MKFNMKNYIEKTAMPVPLPSEETRRQIKDQGYELARDVEKEKTSIDGLDESVVNEMGLNSGEVMRTIPVKDSFEYQGRTVRPIKVDKEHLVVIDSSVIPGQPGDIPNNYLRIPLTDPAVVEFLEGKNESFRPHVSKIEGIVKDWNNFVQDLDNPDKFTGVNIVQIPLMIFKEKEQTIKPRMDELRGMESSLEAKTEQAGSSALVQAEIEWREKINNHELNFQDTVDTLKKLYKGREQYLIQDLNSGAIDPSDEWKQIWLRDFPERGPDGQVKTSTLLQRYVDTKLREKEEERNKPVTLKDEVDIPGEILEDMPKKSPLGTVPTFTGPAANIASRDIAVLIGVRDEIKDLSELEANLTQAANQIASMESKSDDYILQNPEEYLAIMNTIGNEASKFIRRYSKPIQNKGETWKKRGPKDFDTWTDNAKRQLKRYPDGSMELPGKINATFLGSNIASAAVAMYLRKILLLVQKIDERLNAKRQNVQASSLGMTKTAEGEDSYEQDEILIQKMLNSDEPTENQSVKAPAQDKSKMAQMAAIRLTQMIDSEKEINTIFSAIADVIGKNPNSAAELPEEEKRNDIYKAIRTMPQGRLAEFNRFLSSF